MQRSLNFLIKALFAVMLIACQSQPDAPTPTVVPDSTLVTPEPNSEDDFIVESVQPDAETGVVRGRVISALTTEPLASTVVAMAQVTRQGEEGAFVLNSASSPMNVSDVDGYFIIPNVPPGEFVMIVGDPYDVHEIILNPETEMAQTYFVEQGRVTEVGEVVVDIGK
jgi:hypothetical protein